MEAYRGSFCNPLLMDHSKRMMVMKEIWNIPGISLFSHCSTGSQEEADMRLHRLFRLQPWWSLS
jgi:hypothetical protein